MNTRDFFLATATDEPWHVTRYCLAAEWLSPHLQPGMTVLDAGQSSPFTEHMKKAGATVTQTHPQDLSEPLSLGVAEYDIVTCMEVIEHIKDQPHDGSRDIFTGSGVASLLQELYVATKRGGVMFLSTPNVCGVRNLHRLLSGDHPYAYQPHHREFSPRESLEMIAVAGWSIERHSLVTVWGDVVPALQSKAIQLLASTYYTNRHSMHGDCLFAIARKP